MPPAGTDSRSRGSNPTIASSNSAASATVRVIGQGARARTRRFRVGDQPKLGFMPNTPQTMPVS
jgi:hypothetical protein